MNVHISKEKAQGFGVSTEISGWSRDKHDYSSLFAESASYYDVMSSGPLAGSGRLAGHPDPVK